MTLTSTLIKDQFNGDGATTAFPTSFVFWDFDDLEVIHTDAANVETVWVRGTHYTVSGGNGATGTVMVSTSPTDYTPASGTRLTIRSALANTQPTSLPAGGPFPSASVERRFDQNVRLIQQLAEEVTRTIQLAVSSTSSGVAIPEPEASRFLRWDAAADNLENADITGGGSIGIPVAITEGGTGADLSAVPSGALVKMNGGQTAFEAAVADTDFMKAGAKGADIASASPLVLGTDGNYFDVTGTTGFSAITVAAGRLFMLQFDAALTITHGASIDLPGEADITTAAGDRLIGFATAADTVQVLSYAKASRPPSAGRVVQVVHNQDGAVATGTTVMVFDDTIPQNTEGTEFMTLAITPTSASNILLIDVVLNGSHSAAPHSNGCALFQDSTADALAASRIVKTTANHSTTHSFRHKMTAGTTSSTTFKVRAGSTTGTYTLNGGAGSREFGGVMASSITITEIAA